ncbi:B3 domain-containing protein, DNA-binding pseudobarrel domain protein [Tanacetum coccineum]|uniref:B3 domain-containing protein, DNA-binding pseudobarrel domain protein n=1 Tax=Tanacetum coccineum TaxID=301880 RepID=A0ABQ5GGR9_9ASTR
MAFRPYKRPPQLIDFLNLFSKDCPSPLTSTSFTNLPSEAEPEFIELSLGVKAPVTTSSFIDYSATPISFIPPQDPPKKTTYPTCGDILKKPVHKKKRTNKAKCGQMDANKQFQIVCWDALATQPIEEPQKKKRKITPKIKSGPVVKNEVTERLQKFITGDEMNGSEPKLVIQKVLYMSDLKQDQNRLMLPFKKLETEDFLTIEEKLALENENEIEVRLVGPTLKMYKEPMRLVIWNMTNTRNLVLKTNWYRFVEDNKEHLKELSKIQLWSFRKDQQLCFAIAVVARPPEGLNSVAN